jgi:aryl-alcohol dehydrogenase-like predicted oxidoreductase
VVATKGGHYRNGDDFPIDARPEALRRDCALSRDLLGVDRIDLYFLHHPDPRLPLRASIAALAELQTEGWIRHIGVSNVSLAQLDEALSVAPVAAVQNRFSPLEQTDRPVVDFCAKTGIAYLAYSPLGGRASALANAFPAAAALAARKGVSMPRLALAWLLTVSPTLIPITGAGRPESIRDSALAADLQLTEDELVRLDFAHACTDGSSILPVQCLCRWRI